MNFYEVLTKQASRSQHKIFFIYSAEETHQYTYAQAYQKALCILDFLQKSGMQKQDKLIFQMENNEQFILTFWACILGGIVAVPVVNDNTQEFLHKIVKISQNLNGGNCICTKERLAHLEKYAAEEEHVTKLFHRVIDLHEAFQHRASAVPAEITNEDIVILLEIDMKM